MTDLRKTNPTTIFLVDNGACYCGEHLGSSARFTGCDISGQPIYRVTPDDVRECGGDVLQCESCGRKASALWEG